jgi:hypothetical protein
MNVRFEMLGKQVKWTKLESYVVPNLYRPLGSRGAGILDNLSLGTAMHIQGEDGLFSSPVLKITTIPEAPGVAYVATLNSTYLVEIL